ARTSRHYPSPQPSPQGERGSDPWRNTTAPAGREWLASPRPAGHDVVCRRGDTCFEDRSRGASNNPSPTQGQVPEARGANKTPAAHAGGVPVVLPNPQNGPIQRGIPTNG